MSEGYFYCDVKNISRAQNRSVVACAAYRSGERLHDTRNGRTPDFRRRQKGIVHKEILAPEGAQPWVFDRQQLWDTVEQREKRKDSRLAKEIIIAFPHDLDLDFQIMVARQYAQTFVEMGAVADVCLHHPKDSENPHAHIMLTTRHLENEGFGNKITDQEGKRPFDSKKFVYLARMAWAKFANVWLDKAKSAKRLDHRSYAERGQYSRDKRERMPLNSYLEFKMKRDRVPDRETKRTFSYLDDNYVHDRSRDSTISSRDYDLSNRRRDR